MGEPCPNTLRTTCSRAMLQTSRNPQTVLWTLNMLLIQCPCHHGCPICKMIANGTCCSKPSAPSFSRVPYSIHPNLSKSSKPHIKRPAFAGPLWHLSGTGQQFLSTTGSLGHIWQFLGVVTRPLHPTSLPSPDPALSFARRGAEGHADGDGVAGHEAGVRGPVALGEEQGAQEVLALHLSSGKQTIGSSFLE